jgi:hypothetical protein
MEAEGIEVIQYEPQDGNQLSTQPAMRSRLNRTQLDRLGRAPLHAYALPFVSP